MCAKISSMDSPKPRRSRKMTVVVCHYRHTDGKCCFNPVKWKLEVLESGTSFKVCAEHLDWGLTYAGTPAELDTGELTVKIKEV